MAIFPLETPDECDKSVDRVKVGGTMQKIMPKNCLAAMSDTFSIKSVRSDAELAFTGWDGDYFTVELRGTELSAACRIWGYTDCQLLVDLFQHVSTQSRGLTDVASWASIEGDLAITVRGDKLGHVFLKVELQHCRGVEDWHLTCMIETELGQLPKIAAAASRFFRHGQCS